MRKVDKIYENSVFSVTIFKDLTILDSGAIIHIFNNLLSQFLNFQKAPHGDYLITGDSHVSILEYGNITLQSKNGNGWILRLKNMAYCTNLTANLISFSCFMDKGIH